MREIIIFGRGEIGVRWLMSFDTVSIVLEKLSAPQQIGTSTTKKGKDIVKIRFENLDSLNVLLDTLQQCKKGFEFQKSIPLELRFGA